MLYSNSFVRSQSYTVKELWRIIHCSFDTSMHERNTERITTSDSVDAEKPQNKVEQSGYLHTTHKFTAKKYF